MNPLKKFWSALEDVPGSAASLVEWQFRLGSDFDCAKSLLMPTDKRAASIPSSDDPYVRYRVVDHGPDDIVGIRGDDCSEIQLTKQDVLIYRLDRRHLVRTIATVFNWDAADDPVDGVPHTSQAGIFRPFAGYAFPVYLTIPQESADLMRAVEVVSARSDTAFIVLAPTLRRMQPACELLLRNREACFLALAESIVSDSAGQWVATPAGTQRLAAFQQAIIPEATEAAAPAFFPTPTGATWSDVRIRFVDGETVSVKVRGVSKTLVYAQMGMADGRNARADVQWQLLRSFAQGFGVLTWDSPGACRKNQKRKELLRDKLREFFRIDGEPILSTDDGGWRTAFSIEPDA